jgi:ubiquinone/menaquinone biosynthesis C-methylase UbiE
MIEQNKPKNIQGNYYDKYTSINPIAKFLVRRYLDSLQQLVADCRPESILEIGCGDGTIAGHMRRWHPSASIFASDVGAEIAAVARNRFQDLRVFAASAERLPFADDAFDLIVCPQVFEHLIDPLAALEEVRRVTRKHVIFGVPREPLWRMMNVLTFRYVKALGNTPGHIQHWSKTGFEAFVRKKLIISSMRAPFPWTLLSAKKR